MKNFWLIFFVIALIEFFVVKILVCCFRKAVIFLRTQRNIYKRKDGRWEGRYFKEYDKNGKIIADYSACVNMGADSAFQINDKIYTIFNGGVAYMDLDGKNYGEMMQ